jgi:hypothetical protein
MRGSKCCVYCIQFVQTMYHETSYRSNFVLNKIKFSFDANETRFP